MRALIIDGGQAVRSMVAYVLRTEGFDVKEAADIPEVRGLLAQGFVPDFMIACRFDEADGAMSLKSMKAHPDLKYVPVLLIAGKDELARQMEWKEAGVTCWITAPFTPEEILEMVRIVMFERAEQ